MDLDRYIQRNDGSWRRLEQLTNRGRKLSSDELAEVVALYPRVSADLSHARTRYGDPDLNARLSGIVGNANALVYGTNHRSRPRVATFFLRTFPQAVWTTRPFIAVSALCLFVPAVAVGLWLAHSGIAMDAAVPPEVQRLIAGNEFRDYYSTQAAGDFSVMLMLNNIRVALLAFGLGVVPIVGTGWVLVTNGANVGVMAAVMHRAGEGTQFWSLVTPHGLLELTSVVVAGAAGLRLSWALVAPGDRTRLEAFASEGLRAVVIAGGLAVTFVVAALIEAFVTPSGLPDAVRIAIGVAALAAFVAYIVAFGPAHETPGGGSESSGSLDSQVRITEL